MAITRPVTRTIISTSQWGVPVTDELNRLTDAVAALTPGPWLTVPLVNGWNHEGGFSPLQYRKNGDRIEFRSSAQPNPANGAMCTMPVGYRVTTSHRWFVPVYRSDTASTAMIRCDLTTSGLITWSDMPASALFCTFTGLWYPTT